jgi:hypothetical protein
LPGTGALRRGTGEGDIARLFCLSPGKNNSLGSVIVATMAVVFNSIEREGRGEERWRR